MKQKQDTLKKYNNANENDNVTNLKIWIITCWYKKTLVMKPELAKYKW